MKKSISIVTIPIVYYHDSLYWGLYTLYTGKVRQKIRRHPAGGRQIAEAFKNALENDGDILIIADDKFNFEQRNGDELPSSNEIKEFVMECPLPFFEEEKDRILIPPEHLSFGCAVSEKKLYAASRHTFGFPGECANEWSGIVEFLRNSGYEKVHAYIPKICMKGVCYSNSFLLEKGLSVNIKFNFTENATESEVIQKVT